VNSSLPDTDADVDTDGGSEKLAAVVPDALSGKRFDQALAELFPQFSRSRLTGWIKDGKARLNEAQARPRDPVAIGDRVAIEAEMREEVSDAPEAIDLDVLYEDRDVLVINKAAGLVVHPGAGNATGTLVNALLHFDPKLREVPRAGIVHRLDKDTSGALVVARNVEAHAALVAQLSEREVSRRYLALVVGEIIAGGRIDKPIDRSPHDRLKMAVREGGREAVTHYRVAERFRAHTLLNCQLETGRTHQIRVHLASIRHGIVGDPLYGSGLKIPKAATPELDAALRGFRRQALHAQHLEFEHPRTGKPIRNEAPVPADFEQLLAALRADSKAFAAKR
jgi:23S rRNA pseudouridine1911/1915/1917 synthase